MDINQRHQLFNDFSKISDTFGSFKNATALDSFVKCALYAQYHRLIGDANGVESWNQSLIRSLSHMINDMAIDGNFGFKVYDSKENSNGSIT